MKKRLLNILLCTAATVFIAGGMIAYQYTNQISFQNPPDPSPLPESKLKPSYVDISIASVGDILIHNTVYMAAYDSSTGLYDFSSQFQYVKSYLENADITVANLETSLAGPEQGYSGYPKFNTPDSIVDALKESGVDIVTAANNHRLDQDITGFYRTIDVVKNKGLDIIGVKATEKETTYVVKDIKGVKVAFVNFGYGYPQYDGSLSINGLILPVNMTGLMDTFNPQDFDSSAQTIKARITEARQAGAEIVILCMHWGDEYQRLPSTFQQDLASVLADCGADVIFGGHPHVLQPFVFLATDNNGTVPVFYSQGNFISDQRQETVDNIYTEQGIIANVTIRVYPDHTHHVLQADAVPTWVNKKRLNNQLIYEVIPAKAALDNPGLYPLLKDADLERIRFCRDTVQKLMPEAGKEFESQSN